MVTRKCQEQRREYRAPFLQAHEREAPSVKTGSLGTDFQGLVHLTDGPAPMTGLKKNELSKQWF